MKRIILAVLFLALVPAMAFSFFDDLIKGAVDEAAKNVKNEAIKAADADLAAVINQVPVTVTPKEAQEEVAKRVKALLGKKSKYLADTVYKYRQDTTATAAERDEDDASWAIQAIGGCAVIATGSEKSRTDKGIWESRLKQAKQSGDINNSVMSGITDWSPYAARPYIIMIIGDRSGDTVSAISYQKTLDIIKEVFPDLKKLPGSLWLIEE